MVSHHTEVRARRHLGPDTVSVTNSKLSCSGIVDSHNNREHSPVLVSFKSLLVNFLLSLRRCAVIYAPLLTACATQTLPPDLPQEALDLPDRFPATGETAARGARSGLWPRLTGGLENTEQRRAEGDFAFEGNSWSGRLAACCEVDLWGRVRAGARAA